MKKVFSFIALSVLFVSVSGFASPCPSGHGFGLDDLLGSLISNPKTVAKSACPSLGIVAGENLYVFAQEDAFAIQSFDGSQVAVRWSVPSQADYVFSGSCPSRSASQIVNKASRIQVSTDNTNTIITVINYGQQEVCRLQRCPSFGPCQ